MKTAIFWFRQDLRTHDNRGLIRAIAQNNAVLPIFILDKNIIPSFGGLCDKKFGFVREALENLSAEIEHLSGKPLAIFHDTPENIIPQLVKEYKINAVYTNKSYGNYGIQRDAHIATLLQKENVTFLQEKDFLLVEPHEVPQRKVFTPFFKLWKKTISDTQELSITPFQTINIGTYPQIKEFISIEKHPYFTLAFGRKRLAEYITPHYEETRNMLDKDGTSKLAPYLRFGIFSVRQIYQKASVSESYISELAWREFWQHIAYYFPESKTQAFQENKRHIIWDENTFLFERFCEAKTGYPIVDASIKQLLETNWMHGRSRMIVASFLTKDLHLDWKLGEQFFKQHLLDYDENVNIGNWQWSASIGADPKPLRIFNPILQSQKFDPQTHFITKYIPELTSQNLQAIHNPLEHTLDYYAPIVDHRIEQKIAREKYKIKNVDKIC